MWFTPVGQKHKARNFLHQRENRGLRRFCVEYSFILAGCPLADKLREHVRGMQNRLCCIFVTPVAVLERTSWRVTCWPYDASRLRWRLEDQCEDTARVLGGLDETKKTGAEAPV
jgi:hypothetical protein